MKVTFEQLKAAFNRVLISRGVDSETADACAEMFARTTESGVYSHGVNRFPRFIQQLDNGDIIPDAEAKRITTLGAIEQWDAQRSIGNLTAKKMMDRAIELAADHGGGFDDEGNLTKEPGVIEKNRRILPMGYWKGSGMSIVLDMIATLLSDGASVAEVTQDNSDEYGVSQIFIAIEVDKLIDGATRDAKLQRIMDYITTAERADENQAIRLPGHEFTTLLAENRRNGITVDDSVWAKIQAL